MDTESEEERRQWIFGWKKSRQKQVGGKKETDLGLLTGDVLSSFTNL